MVGSIDELEHLNRSKNNSYAEAKRNLELVKCLMSAGFEPAIYRFGVSRSRICARGYSKNPNNSQH